MPNELSIPVHYVADMPDHNDCPVGHAYVDRVNKVFVRGTYDTWAHVGMAKDLLGPSPNEKRYLRKSLGLVKGTRLT